MTKHFAFSQYYSLICKETRINVIRLLIVIVKLFSLALSTDNYWESCFKLLHLFSKRSLFHNKKSLNQILKALIKFPQVSCIRLYHKITKP